MFTMAKITNGSSYLDRHLTQNDYYNEAESIVGQWVGKLALSFDLKEGIQARDSAFENLRNNLTPDGSDKLTQRTNTERATTKRAPQPKAGAAEERPVPRRPSCAARARPVHRTVAGTGSLSFLTDPGNPPRPPPSAYLLL